MRGKITKFQRLKQANTRLKNENKRLRDRIAVLEKENKALKEEIEDLKLQIEELKKIIFGGPKSKKKSEGNLLINKKKRQSPKRSSKSYRRQIPKEEDITDIKKFEICHCKDCNTKLVRLKEKEQYIEDVLPISEWSKALKTVVKEVITVGYCNNCRKEVSAKPLNIQKSSLGPNIKQFIAFSTVISRLSYQQTNDFLQTIIKLDISDGEIANLLEKQAGLLGPVFERLKEKIRGEPSVHYDETTWKVQKRAKGDYGWIMSSARSPDAIFRLGQTRGGGNIDELRGNAINQIGISDDYGAYKNAFKIHALCWSHPNRKLRDLANSSNLSDKKLKHCQSVYKDFAVLYKKVDKINKKPFVKEDRIKVVDKLSPEFDKICIPHSLDPSKLTRIKKRLLLQKDCYFVCLLHPGVSLDNNKAERDLRHLVLKRKNSYGSKSQKAADYMSVLYSVLLSAWRRSKETFFENLNEWNKECEG